jgi:DNA invertase Pin-like site-specific DNA recombinase
MATALIYTRKSSDTGDKGVLSLEAQEDRCREVADREGFTEVTVFSEGQGVSATKNLAHVDPSSRPALTALLAAVAADDLVISWEVPRLGRTEVDAGLTLRAVLDAGANVLTLDGTDTRGGDQMGFGLRAILYAEETRRLRERVKAGKMRQRAAGKYLGGVPPFGFRRDPDGRLEIDPELQPIAVEMAERAIAGESFRSLALDLETRGIAGSNGGRWAAGTMTKMLRGARAEDLLGCDLYLRVKAARPQGSRPYNRSVSLLHGILRCGRCNRALNFDRSVNSYRCSAMNRNLCQGVSVSSALVERALILRFVATVLAALDDSESSLFSRISAAIGAQEDPTVSLDRDRLNGELEEITEMVAALGSAYATGSLDLAAFTAANSPLTVRRGKVAEALGDLPTPLGDPGAIIGWAQDLEGPAEILDGFRSFDMAAQRLMLSALWPHGVGVAPGVRGARFKADRLILDNDGNGIG